MQKKAQPLNCRMVYIRAHLWCYGAYIMPILQHIACSFVHLGESQKIALDVRRL